MSTWWDISTGWANWFHVQGGVAAAGAKVTAVARYPFHLDLFMVGTDNRVYSCWWDERGGWHNWFAVGNLVCRPDSTVTVVSRFPDQLDLFTTASDGKIMSDWWNTRTGWGNWFQVSGGVASAGSAVTAIARYSHHLDLFVISTDNRIYSTWWREGQCGPPGSTCPEVSASQVVRWRQSRESPSTSICSPSPATAWFTALGGMVRSVGRVGFSSALLNGGLCRIELSTPAAVYPPLSDAIDRYSRHGAAWIPQLNRKCRKRGAILEQRRRPTVKFQSHFALSHVVAMRLNLPSKHR